MSLSKRLRAAGASSHPLREWKSNAEHLGASASSARPSTPSLEDVGPFARKCNRCNAALDRHPCSACGCPEFRIEAVEVVIPEGVTRRPFGFYCFDEAWSRYGEGPFPDVPPPPGNMTEAELKTVRNAPKVSPSPEAVRVVPLPGQTSFLESVEVAEEVNPVDHLLSARVVKSAETVEWRRRRAQKKYLPNQLVFAIGEDA